MVGIYKITSPSGRVYIGQSVNVEKRIKHYKYLHCKKQRRLYNSLIKYGYENHVFEVVEECKFEDLNNLERYYQEKYNVLGKFGLSCELTNCNNGSRKLSEQSKKNIGLKNSGSNNGMFGVTFRRF